MMMYTCAITVVVTKFGAIESFHHTLYRSDKNYHLAALHCFHRSQSSRVFSESQ